jgi:hypothetical protein
MFAIRDVAFGTQNGVTGTPTMFINSERVRRHCGVGAASNSHQGSPTSAIKHGDFISLELCHGSNCSPEPVTRRSIRRTSSSVGPRLHPNQIFVPPSAEPGARWPRAWPDCRVRRE